ncbi:hypothetical protein AB1Y20_005881 [Prymnesium parvum]|uniref:Chromo domain-containing protein n=1 Tax=Prymnesium parvum TaxID=97485 RepID=A0AB34J473_PRYPA
MKPYPLRVDVAKPSPFVPSFGNARASPSADAEPAERQLDRILAKRQKGGRTEFLVKWHNSSAHTWEPAKAVSKEAIAEYDEKRQRRQQQQADKEASGADAAPPERQPLRILAQRRFEGGQRYLVQWAGSSAASASWEFSKAVGNASLVQEFETAIRRLRNTTLEQLRSGGYSLASLGFRNSSYFQGPSSLDADGTPRQPYSLPTAHAPEPGPARRPAASKPRSKGKQPPSLAPAPAAPAAPLAADRSLNRVGLAPLGNLLRKRLAPVSDEDDELLAASNGAPPEPPAKVRKAAAPPEGEAKAEGAEEASVPERLQPPISIRATLAAARGGGRVRLTLRLVGAPKVRVRKRKMPGYLTVRLRLCGVDRNLMPPLSSSKPAGLSSHAGGKPSAGVGSKLSSLARRTAAQSFSMSTSPPPLASASPVYLTPNNPAAFCSQIASSLTQEAVKSPKATSHLSLDTSGYVLPTAPPGYIYAIGPRRGSYCVLQPVINPSSGGPTPSAPPAGASASVESPMPGTAQAQGGVPVASKGEMEAARMAAGYMHAMGMGNHASPAAAYNAPMAATAGEAPMDMQMVGGRGADDGWEAGHARVAEYQHAEMMHWGVHDGSRGCETVMCGNGCADGRMALAMQSGAYCDEGARGPTPFSCGAAHMRMAGAQAGSQQSSSPYIAVPMQGGNYQLVCMMDQNRSNLAQSTYLVPMSDGSYYQMTQFAQMPVTSMPMGSSCAGMPSHAQESAPAASCGSSAGAYVLAVPMISQEEAPAAAPAMAQVPAHSASPTGTVSPTLGVSPAEARASP